MSMADEIYEYVSDMRTVTFAELDQRIEGFTGGDKMIVINNDRCSNIVWWVGLTDAAIDALEELRNGKRIHPLPTSPLTYFYEGRALDMPIAKSIRHYKKLHWIPLVFNPGPDPKSKAEGRDGVKQ